MIEGAANSELGVYMSAIVLWWIPESSTVVTVKFR